MLELGKDIDIVKNPSSVGDKRKAIVVVSSIGPVLKLVRSRSVAGFVFDDASLIRKAIEMIRENDKLVVIPVSSLLKDDPRSRVRSLNRARRLYKFAVKSRTPIAVVSLARDKDHLLSSMQLLEVSKTIGATGERAKEALTQLGRLT